MVVSVLDIFDRTAVAKIVGLDPAVVKNWSTGKPLKIEASIYAPGKRGAQSLYSREDVYLFALAKVWSELGFAFDAIGRVLEKVKNTSQVFSPDTRGGLVLAKLKTAQPIVTHIPKTLPANEAQIEHARIIMPLMLGKDFYGAYYSPTGAIFDWVDKRIGEHRANEKKSR